MRALRDSRHRLAFVIGAASVIAATLIAGNQISARASDGQTAAAAAGGARAGAPPSHSLFAGIPQRGAALGSRKAPVTLVEYADLQCPYCAQWTRETLPVLVNRYVRTGKLRIVFRGLAFIGPDSYKALSTVVAAGRQNHLWDVLHALYERQGAENAGWVTDGLLSEIAAGIPGLDGKRLEERASAPSVNQQIERTAAAARAAGVTGTPSFLVGRSGGRLEPLHPGSLGPTGTAPAIRAVLDE